MTDLSIIVPVRDQEQHVATIVRAAQQVGDHVSWPWLTPSTTPSEVARAAKIELLALDERSGDNTLSVLSVLQGQVPGLRTMQDVGIGQSIRLAATLARGEVWLVIDQPIDPTLAAWGISQVLRGQRAAVVPGEILAVDRAIGQAVLRRFAGGLVSCQAAVARHLRTRGEAAAFSPPPDASAAARARLLVRAGLGRIGLFRFDRPRVG